MKKCWQFLPEDRINFDAICSTLKEIQTKFPAPEAAELILTQVPGILPILPDDTVQTAPEMILVKKSTPKKKKKSWFKF